MTSNQTVNNYIQDTAGLRQAKEYKLRSNLQTHVEAQIIRNEQQQQHMNLEQQQQIGANLQPSNMQQNKMQTGNKTRNQQLADKKHLQLSERIIHSTQNVKQSLGIEQIQDFNQTINKSSQKQLIVQLDTQQQQSMQQQQDNLMSQKSSSKIVHNNSKLNNQEGQLTLQQQRRNTMNGQVLQFQQVNLQDSQFSQSQQQSMRSIVPFQNELEIQQKINKFYSPQKQPIFLRGGGVLGKQNQDSLIINFPKQFKAFQQINHKDVNNIDMTGVQPPHYDQNYNQQQLKQFDSARGHQQQQNQQSFFIYGDQNSNKSIGKNQQLRKSRPQTASTRSSQSKQLLNGYQMISPQQSKQMSRVGSNSFVQYNNRVIQNPYEQKFNQEQRAPQNSNGFLMTQQITLINRNNKLQTQQISSVAQNNLSKMRSPLQKRNSSLIVKSNTLKGSMLNQESSQASNIQKTQQKSSLKVNVELANKNSANIDKNQIQSPFKRQITAQIQSPGKDRQSSNQLNQIQQKQIKDMRRMTTQYASNTNVVNEKLQQLPGKSRGSTPNRMSTLKFEYSNHVRANNGKTKEFNQEDEDEEEDEESDYGDEDEEDDESYGEESDKEDELEFENEYENADGESIDQIESLNQKSSDLSTEVSHRSPLLKGKSERIKRIEEIEEESQISDDENLQQVANLISQEYQGKTSDQRQKINLDLGCPKEILVRTMIQRSNSSLSQNERISPLLKVYQQPLQVNDQLNKNYLTHYANNDYEAKDPYTQDHPVILLRSLFDKRPPVIFFQYPPQSNQTRDESFTYKMKEGKYRLKFRISEQVHTYNCVVNSLCKGGFTQTEGSLWNVLWSAPLKPECLRNYDQYKRCNHFPGTFQLGRKDTMYRHVSKMIREFGEEYRIVPKTWILPEDTRRFQKEREDTEQAKLWIVKPANSSCGRGIRILTKTSSLPKKGQHVACEYIMKPHLINGYKYDMRLYVFITSYEPLTIYLYEEGLARFATQPYNTKNTKVRFAHLTNFSVNKNAQNFKAADENGSNPQGQQASKWSLKMLRDAFQQMNIDYDKVFVTIKDLIIKSILSVEPIIANNMQRSSKNRHLCFELYGFDVILDSDLKPWLLEVNVLPSFSSSSLLDKRIKTSLLSDVFQTIGVIPYNKKKVLKELEAQKWGKFSGIQLKTSSQQVQSSTIDPKTGKSQDLNISSVNIQEYDQSLDDIYIHKQSIQSPTKIRLAKELISLPNNNCNNLNLNYDEQLVIVEKLEEQSRKGGFERIFPVKKSVDQYTKYFKAQRATNLIFWKWLKMKKEDKLACLKDFKVNRNQSELLNKMILEY